MDDKHTILKHLIHTINQHSINNIALVHYITDNNQDYYIFLSTNDDYMAGKIHKVEVDNDDNEDDNYTYCDIPFDYSNEVYFYFIDDLIVSLIMVAYKNTIICSKKCTTLIKHTYHRKSIHIYCTMCDNLNYIDLL